MADIKIKRTETGWGHSSETVLEVNGESYIDKEALKLLFPTLERKTERPEEQPEKEVKLTSVVQNVGGVDWDVVAIYDNAGIPSIMHRFRRITNAELFGGNEDVHPAFIIGGEVYDEIYISVYENTEINGKPYSLPHQKAWVNITNDDAAKACFSKGDGWHMLTAAEWGLLANLSLKNGTLPHGNTCFGRYHADGTEHGEIYDSYYTLTGSGPATWTHDHTPEGVHDLCGNHWEMVRGMRLKDGRLQAAADNDAALDIDLTAEGDGWQAVTDDEGKPIRISVDSDGNIEFTTSDDAEHSYDGCEWSEVEIDCESEQLKELALFAGEPEAYCYIDSSEGEYFPYRGNWSSGTNAGVFWTNFSNARSNSSAGIGFRSAYFKKN